jgi:hypothetical protein
MPLDPAFDSDDSQPWWQIGPPLRITVHPASPPSPQANNSAPFQGVESDGYPNDWIEPDGYPDDWITPATAPPLRRASITGARQQTLPPVDPCHMARSSLTAFRTIGLRLPVSVPLRKASITGSRQQRLPLVGPSHMARWSPMDIPTTG